MKVKIVENELLRIAQKHYEDQDGFAILVDDEEQNMFLNNLKEYPHAYVLGCIMDKQIKAEKAWKIPYKVYKELGRFDIDFLSNISLEKYKELFENGSYHRFNDSLVVQVVQQ